MTATQGGTKSLLCALLLTGGALSQLQARTSNGNDFALYFSEAKAPAEREALLADAKDRPHFFRYLQIMEIGEVKEEGKTGIAITAFEPASRMDVKFVISKPVSLSKLRADPVSKLGDAIAVTGKVASADVEANTISLDGTIVRHKDRLSPAKGKEMLYEVDPGAVFYNYTAGSRPVTLTYKDRDLIRHKERIVAEGGPDAWVKFLEDEVAKREKARAASGGKTKAGGGS